jgi:citrate lyase subunit beta/citryl-CoA lyase
MPLFRSLMFVPGNQQRKIDKVKDLASDAIIFDLEDSVPANEKKTARQMVRLALQENNERVNFVRINDVSTPHLMADLEAVIHSGLHGVMLSKADIKDHVIIVDYLLSHLERQNAIEPGTLEIIPLIESASGVHHAYDIATVSTRVKRLAFGSVDYTLDIQAELSDEGAETFYARSQLVVASRAAGIESPIDAVHIRINDKEGLQQSTQMAKRLGYQGKLVIHPDQIEIVNKVFAPTSEEIEYARRIVLAYEEANKAGSAAFQLDGRMIDSPVVARFKKIIELSKETP